MKKEQNANTQKREGSTPMEIALSVVRNDTSTGINTDPLGSWTGVPEDETEIPIQDADDL